MLAKHARHRPDHLAVVFGQHRVGYGDFDRSTNRVANAFAGLGVAKGERIATFLSNSLELLEVYWAAAKIGAVVVPLSPLLRGKGLSTLLRDADVGIEWPTRNPILSDRDRSNPSLGEILQSAPEYRD